MSEWIRHRGSINMPKCLEGKLFEVRYRNGKTRSNGCVMDWHHEKHPLDVMAYRITGDIEQPKTAIELQAEEVGIPEPVRLVDDAQQAASNGEPTTAPDFLQSALNMLTQRGKDYDKQEGERSAMAVAVAFNAITGKDLTDAEVYLVLQLVKDVRQWQCADYHADSALDCVAYAALKAEALASK